MIKISGKIWTIAKPEHEDNLAYMCGYEETKEQAPTASVAKMQSTGRDWARTHSQHVYKTDESGSYIRGEHGVPIVDHTILGKEGIENIYDNTPMTGFYVGDSVSRWSTSNKLFRVKDPRNFTVEIPTGNLATLLHHTTVVKGFVQDACVWGREGNSHILLPITSQPYLNTLDKMDVLENKLVSKKDLKAGDIVKFFEDDREHQYVGKIRLTWTLTPQHRTRDGSSYWWSYKYVDGVAETIRDDKWVDAFTYNGYSDKLYVETPSSPKIVSVLRNEHVSLTTENIYFYVPDRVRNKMNEQGDLLSKAEVIQIERK